MVSDCINNYWLRHDTTNFPIEEHQSESASMYESTQHGYESKKDLGKQGSPLKPKLQKKLSMKKMVSKKIIPTISGPIIEPIMNISDKKRVESPRNFGQEHEKIGES